MKDGASIVCTQELFRSQYFCQVEDHRFFDLAETIPGPSTEALSALARTHGIQGFEVTGLAAVLHVVEHFSWHTGQAVWIAKARAGAEHGLAFYDDARVNKARNA